VLRNRLCGGSKPRRSVHSSRVAVRQCLLISVRFPHRRETRNNSFPEISWPLRVRSVYSISVLRQPAAESIDGLSKADGCGRPFWRD